MSSFTYRSVIWHNCNESDKQKLEKLYVRALRCVSNKPVPLHGDDDYGLTLCNRCLQDTLIFKAVNGMLSEYLRDLFVVRNNVNCLRGTNKLVVPRKKTLNFGLKSTTFICAKVWNSLPDELRSTTILKNRIYGWCERTRFVMHSFLWFIVMVLNLGFFYVLI